MFLRVRGRVERLTMASLLRNSGRSKSIGAIVLIAVGTALGTCACGSPIGRGTTLYQQQNYIEAAEAFERTEDRLATMQPGDRIRYGLYRGLTFLQLGDLRSAEHWLDYAQAEQHKQSQSLTTEELRLLQQGRRLLSERIRDSWPKPEPSWSKQMAASKSEPVLEITP